jgi:nitrogenase molybdenum-iron protein alpha/beta subunit
MPMCTIAGTDYARVMREALSSCRKPSFVLAPRAGAGDWLDGYAGVLEALASGIDLGRAKPASRKVALVGYLMDRNEGEHLGNLRELERMLRALDLDPVSIWLSGRPYDELREARRAGAVISLPHGRSAARILARRLNARLIEAELPFGLEASRRFMEQLGREFGREAAAREFIAAELDAAAPRLAWSVPHAFLNRRFAFAGDPHYAVGFTEQIEALGGRISALLLMADARHLTAAQRQELERRPATAFEPLPGAVVKTWAGLARGGADLIVGNGFAFRELKPGLRWMEFGFPSECTHFLHEEAFLGFRGALAFLSRVANEVVRGLVLEPADQEIAVSSALPNSAR